MLHNRIDIQLHTECNRKCEWCIFRYYDMPKAKMNNDTFEAILKYVKDHIDDFDKPLLFVLHKFFEPLIYPELLYKRTKRIKELFPESIVKINSNCDFLSVDTIYALKYVDKLSVPKYGNYENLLKLCKIEEIDRDTDGVYFGHINNTIIIMHTHDFPVFSRGSALFNKYNDVKFNVKTESECCVFPEYFSVAYDGSVMPCYETIPYIYIHNKAIIGNINDENFVFPKSFSILNKECCLHCNADLNSCPSKNR